MVPSMIRRDAELEGRIGEVIVRNTALQASAQWVATSSVCARSVRRIASIPHRVRQHGIIGVKETTE